MNRKRMCMIGLFSCVIFCVLPIIQVSAQDTITFDSKLQLSKYISYSADLVAAKDSDLDADGLGNVIIAYKTQLVIYESNVIVKTFNAGDSNFVEENSNISSIEIGNVNGNGFKEIIVGTGKGNLIIIHCVNATTNNFTVFKKINFASYGGSELAKYRAIPTILTGDMDNNGTNEIVIGNHRCRLYAFMYNQSSDAFESIYLANHDTLGIQWVLKPSAGLQPEIDNDINCLSVIDESSGDFILFIGTDNDFYTIKFVDVTNGFGGSVYPTEIDLVNTSIYDLTITDTNSLDTYPYEVAFGTLTSVVYVYGMINPLLYNNKVNYVPIRNSGTMIPTGNKITAICAGDFITTGINVISVGSTQILNKVQVLNGTSSVGAYWQSSTYMRENVLNMESIYSSTTVDTLLVTTSRHLYYLSKSYTDTDTDKLSDLSEQVFYLTDPAKADTDEDGLNDGIEIFYYKTDPLNPDTDGDLIPDGLEVLLGTDPLDPMSSIILIILIPTIIIISALAVLIVVRKSMKEKKAAYEKVKNTPNLMPQVRRLILQRLENFNKDFKGFKNKGELNKFRRNIETEMITIVMDRLYNFLEYLRLKGINFTDRQEEYLKTILKDTLEPVVKKTDVLLKNLGNYETKYKLFKEQYSKLLVEYASWKKAAKKGTKIVEELIKCPNCKSLGPKGSAFCLECGAKFK